MSTKTEKKQGEKAESPDSFGRYLVAATTTAPTPCTECGGSGYERCGACNDGGVDSSGSSCSSCVKPSPCPRCGGDGAEPPRPDTRADETRVEGR